MQFTLLYFFPAGGSSVISSKNFLSSISEICSKYFPDPITLISLFSKSIYNVVINSPFDFYISKSRTVSCSE